LVSRKATTERHEAARQVTMMWIEAPTRRCGVQVKTVGNSNSPHLRPSSKVRRNGLPGVLEQGMSTKVPRGAEVDECSELHESTQAYGLRGAKERPKGAVHLGDPDESVANNGGTA
jgi:hypothetical protein